MQDLSQAVPPKTLSEWHNPSSRTDVIRDLIHGVDRYNPSNLSFMEDYLASQVQDGSYDLLANLAILKLYQFNPQLSNPDVIINILLKSLSASVNGSDFNLSMSLLREPAAILHDIESDDARFMILIPFLTHLHDLIRNCRFAAFWSEFNGGSEGATILRAAYLPQHPHLIPTLRVRFATSIASSFSRISLIRVQRWLDLSESDINDWCASVSWGIEGSDAVIPKNGDNDVKAGVVRENVELSQLTKLIAAAAY
ncbi:eukaryotic translation initiation factor 3 subunit K [Tremella mesenterica]|uniref:Eukaryotic translation initiation factor 3 subunit K n=1 Tax=Tremella mesenterica TaxID=5217 RepID=A0A4Q1BU88_TREME|nr:uncharacterized protein TREMEDRAFT_71023 [Tremella mesenterica DSM 1558]EIW73678.1 hypothetical protein TREMEDRAFT_71023 [Tremella mesenterica DSM 1558]RXK41588.1 eukaryotic translation initiation factor 3 subunit K [Tremella mesenterica]